jgi:PPK2 family polyphosphate:nucleotide phosphotransferase
MIKLQEIPTFAPEHLDKKATKEATAALVKQLGELQRTLQAQQKHAVLVVLQGMDASGKDGAVEQVFDDCSPTGIDVIGFKKPTEEEFAHDFLWRIHRHAPRRGMMNIFIRSHYEDILIQRVHKWISEEKAEKRMQAINAFEELLQFDNHTTILKFYLHISKEQQEIELKQRLDDNTKHWKHNAADWREREYWHDYRRCYESVINQSVIPWHIIPVDQRWYRDYLIAKTMVETLSGLNLAYPSLPA